MLIWRFSDVLLLMSCAMCHFTSSFLCRCTISSVQHTVCYSSKQNKVKCQLCSHKYCMTHFDCFDTAWDKFRFILLFSKKTIRSYWTDWRSESAVFPTSNAGLHLVHHVQRKLFAFRVLISALWWWQMARILLVFGTFSLTAAFLEFERLADALQ